MTVGGRRALGLSMLASAIWVAFPTSAAAGSSDPSDDAARTAGSGATSGPSVRLDRDEVAPGEAVIVAMEGFESRSVTVTVCGNEARRGSADCNMRAAKGREIDPDQEETLVRLTIATPPAPCPCLVRVANSDQSEIGIASITVVGHPVADPVDPAERGPLIEPLIDVEVVDRGPLARLRTALGGSTTYAVTVKIRNLITTPVDGLAVSPSVGKRNDDDLVTIPPFAPPGRIAPGQTWVDTVEVDLPTPVWGTVSWRVAVSGAGPAAAAETSTSNTPTALYLLTGVLALDVLVLLAKLRRRRRGRRGSPPNGEIVETDLAAVESVQGDVAIGQHAPTAPDRAASGVLGVTVGPSPTSIVVGAFDDDLGINGGAADVFGL